MSRFPSIIGMTLAIGLTLVSGWLYGNAQRHALTPDQLRAVAGQLQNIPHQIGPWHFEESLELDAQALQILDCRGYVHRVYRHRDTGRTLKLAVMMGPGSKMSIHIPEICYQANNFTLLGNRRRIKIPAEPHTPRSDQPRSEDPQHNLREAGFWTTQFRLNDVSRQRLSVLYGWRINDTWMAPDSPRWTLASSPWLLKLQISYASVEDGMASESHSDETTPKSIERFVKSLVQHLSSLRLPG